MQRWSNFSVTLLHDARGGPARFEAMRRFDGRLPVPQGADPAA
jgi:hypothetical protein